MSEIAPVRLHRNWPTLIGASSVAGLLVALVTLLDETSTHAFAATSDGATVVLEGVALRHGNFTLHGWKLSLDSFWTVDAVFYGVATAIFGLRPSSMHLLPAVLGAMVVAVVAFAAVRNCPIRSKVAALVVVGLVLALPGHALSFFFLQGPWHVGTVLYCLVAMLLVATSASRWSFAAGVVLLAAAMLGDLQAVALGVLPVVCAAATTAARNRQLRAGLRMFGAAISSVVLAVAVRLVLVRIGSFSVNESHHTVSLNQFEADISNFVSWSAALLGVRRGAFGGPAVSRLLETPRLVLGLFLVVAFVVSLVEVARRATGGSCEGAEEIECRLDDMLVFGLLGATAVFFDLTLSSNPSYARYLDAVFVFATAIAARFAARLAARVGRNALAIGALVAVVLLASSSIVVAQDLSSPPPRSSTAVLEHFLEEHHLSQGIGDYWAASVVTVETKAKVRIRPVVANLQGVVVPDGRNATARWYAGERFQFVVYDRDPYGRVEPSTIERTFKVPTRSYTVGQYTVLVFARPQTISGNAFP